jgi:hypothetical protein
MKPTSAPRTATRFPGITADARALGCHRTTLFKMLSGYPGFAGLKGLRKRYATLQKNKVN